MNKFLCISAFVGGALLFTGCATNLNNREPSIPYPVKAFNEPAINEVHQVTLGEKMLTQATGHLADCFTSKKSFTKSSGFGVVRSTVTSGHLYCKEYQNQNWYRTAHKNTQLPDERISLPIEIFESDSGDGVKVCFTSQCEAYHEGEYTLDKQLKLEPSSVQQTIEYMGKSDTQLHFTYSETESGMARPAFTRDFQIDLSDGKILSYKGAVIEIIDANNQRLEYKVIKYF